MKVSSLIPAYNEEQTLGNILQVLKQIKVIDEIIVVNDGSEDNTALIAGKYADKVLQHDKNRGKGAALQKGIKYIDTDVLLLLDGDLIGLNSTHIYTLLNPVINREADMSVGVFNKGRGLTDLAQVVTPNLSGQRAIRYEIIKNIDDLAEEGYGVEISIHKYVEKNGKIVHVSLPELSHVMKEEKLGFTKGIFARAKMYWEILITLYKRYIS